MTGSAEALAEIRRVALGLAPELATAEIVGLGWATVDLEATLERLGTDRDDPAWQHAERDVSLGAQATVHHPEAGTNEPIQVLLEPDTEGRLAASLARHGEGFAAIWFALSGPRAPDLERRLGPPAPGPLGEARLVLGGPASGPHVLVLG